MELPDDMLKMDGGYEGCVAGTVTRFGQPPILCYWYDKVIEKNMSDGMSYEEAVEWFEFNQIGAWVGEYTPCYIHKEVPGGD